MTMFSSFEVTVPGDTGAEVRDILRSPCFDLNISAIFSLEHQFAVGILDAVRRYLAIQR